MRRRQTRKKKQRSVSRLKVLQDIARKQPLPEYEDFKKDQELRFEASRRPRFFSSLERQRLLVAVFTADKVGGGCYMDLDELVTNGIFSSIFPLHDEEARQHLLKTWAKSTRSQPLNEVRDYFGEKVAMYFAFLGKYTWWLAGLSVFGIVTQVLQFIDNDADHPVIPIYCLILMLWTTLFFESWKREQNKLAFMWDVTDFEEEERTRPKYRGKVKSGVWKDGYFVSATEIEYLDDDEQARVDLSKRFLRYFLSVPVVVSFIVSTMVGTVSILAYRAYFARPDQFGKLGQIGGGLVNAVFINVMNLVYKKVAIFLTSFENYRTETEYEDALILKVFLFQFVNSYISLFYIAFFKPFNVTVFGIEADECRKSCLDELSTQLLTLVVIMQFINNAKEVLQPVIMGKFKAWRNARKSKKNPLPENTVARKTKFEEQCDMEPYSSTFDDYNELAIQFGYVTMFAAAFPIASFASLLNNIMEIRSDAFKILTGMQRPRYMGAEDIGSWQKVFETLGTLSVLTNVFIVGFTSLYLSGKCEFTEGYSCPNGDCQFFEGDGLRAVQTGYSSHALGGLLVDCSAHRGTRATVCCPPLRNARGNLILEEVGTTWFMDSFHILAVVVICEHAILALRYLLDELIPDMPGYISLAKARHAAAVDAREQLAKNDKFEQAQIERGVEVVQTRAESAQWHDEATTAEYINDEVEIAKLVDEDFVTPLPPH